MKEKNTWSVNEILAHIQRKNHKHCAYLIDGRMGPTGKTWLCSKLNELGFNAHEVGDYLWPFYIHRDKKNHCVYLPGNVILIVLNEYLPEEIVKGAFIAKEDQ